MCHNQYTKSAPLLKDLYQRKTMVGGAPVNDDTVTAKIKDGGPGIFVFSDPARSAGHVQSAVDQNRRAEWRTGGEFLGLNDLLFGERRDVRAQQKKSECACDFHTVYCITIWLAREQSK